MQETAEFFQGLQSNLSVPSRRNMPVVMQSYIMRIIPLFQGGANGAQFAEFLRCSNRIVLGIRGGEGLVFSGNRTSALQENRRDEFVFRVCRCDKKRSTTSSRSDMPVENSLELWKRMGK